MKSLYYLSSISFSQVDLAILPALSRQFKVVYGLIVPKSNNNNVPLEEVQYYCEANNIEIRRFSFVRRLRDVRIAFDFWSVLEDIWSEKPDVLYMTCQDVPILSLLSLTLSRRNTIVAIHDVQFHSKSKFAVLLRWSRRITIAHFESFHVFSKNQEVIFKQRYPEKKTSVIPLSLGYYGGFEGTSPDRREHYSEIRFLFFGNILPYKGLKSLLKAVEKLSERHSRFRLTIAGQCDDWDTQYEPLISSDSPVTRIIRFIDAKMIPTLFLEAHYLILPYIDATQSGPLMLAYHFGLPVIASDIDAFQENIAHGLTGFLYDSTNPTALERVIESAIIRDKAEYISLSNSLREFVKKQYSTEEISKQYAKMFMEKFVATRN